MAKEVVKYHATDGQERNADKNVASATCCNRKHNDKENEEKKCATKVAFENDNNQADAPHDK